MFKITGVDRVNPTKHHGMNFLETGEWLTSGVSYFRDSIPDLDIRCALDISNEVTHVPCFKVRLRNHLWGKDTPLLDLVTRHVVHQLDGLARLHLSRDKTHVCNDPSVNIEDGIKYQSAQDIVGWFGRRRDRKSTRLNSSH